MVLSKLCPQPGSTDIQPKKCAGLNGTTIMVILIAVSLSEVVARNSNRVSYIKVEDLFWNMPTRQKAFKSASEEYAKILDVVTRYSIHNGDNGVGFTCKRLGEVQNGYTPIIISFCHVSYRLSLRFSKYLHNVRPRLTYTLQVKTAASSHRLLEVFE
jgi:hypothetical protein